MRTLGVFVASSLVSFGMLSFVHRDYDARGLFTPVEEAPTEGASLLVQQGGGAVGREFYRFNSRAPQRTDQHTMRAFRDSVGDVWKSTAQIIVRNRQVALAAVVHADGWLVSKSSEVPDRFDVKLADGSRAIGAVRSRNEEMDLVLIKIERTGLAPVTWNVSEEVPVGGWLISTDARQVPLTIGVLSVSNRNIRKEKPVLGVQLGIPDSSTPGARVESVVEGSGADRAGLEVGDIIQDIDGTSYSERDQILTKLRQLKAGQTVSLGVKRESKQVTLAAQMMDLTNSLLDRTEMEVNGQISARATGFQNVMQHDTVLMPHQCGGPLVDVEGRVVGINIARNGRVASLAYHAKNLEPVIRNMLHSAGGPDELIVERRGVIQASAMTVDSNASPIPVSVPTSIQIESLKPEVVFPAPM